MFTEEFLRGGIAKQHFGSWDWSTKASCVTREKNSVFIPFLFLLCLTVMMQREIYQWPRRIHVQQWKDYGNAWGENMWNGDGTRNERKKGTWISLSNSRSRFKEYGFFSPNFKGYFIFTNLLKITPPWTPQKNVSVGKYSILLPACFLLQFIPNWSHCTGQGKYWLELLAYEQIGNLENGNNLVEFP